MGLEGGETKREKTVPKNVIKVILQCELHITFCLELLLAGMALKLNCAADSSLVLPTRSWAGIALDLGKRNVWMEEGIQLERRAL